MGIGSNSQLQVLEHTRLDAGIRNALTLVGCPSSPPHTDMTHHQSVPRTKNTGQLAQCFLVLRIVRDKSLAQYMEALRANCGVHASGLSRTQVGI